jgi:hypothetical protein
VNAGSGSVVRRRFGLAAVAAVAVVGLVACGSRAAEDETQLSPPPAHHVSPDAIDRGLLPEGGNLPRSADAAAAWSTDASSAHLPHSADAAEAWTAPDSALPSGSDPRWAYFRG